MSALTVIFRPLQSVFCFWRGHVSMCKQCSEGSQDPACPGSKLLEPGLPAMPDSYSVSVALRRRERGGRGALFRGSATLSRAASQQVLSPRPGHRGCRPWAPPGSQEQPRPRAVPTPPSPDRRSLRAELWSGSHLLQSLNPLYPLWSVVKNATPA